MLNIKSCASNDALQSAAVSSPLPQPVSASTLRSSDTKSHNSAYDFSAGDTRRGSGVDGKRKLRVLLVDDQTANRKMMCRMLRWLCDSCDEVGDKGDALDFVRRAMNQQRAPDVIICNHQLPGMDGTALFRDLRGHTVGYKGVLIGLIGGGSSIAEESTRLLQVGASQVMRRPLDFHKLETELSGLES